MSQSGSGSMDFSGQSEEDPPSTLPRRLFPSDSYPHGARLNIYLKASVIGSLVDILRGSDTMETILASQFGLPASWCANSAKLIHDLLSRQLITNRRREIWTVFRGKPLRFSLREFHIISGLCCSPLPSEDVIQAKVSSGSTMWTRLFDLDDGVPSISEVLDMMRNPYLDDWKLLPLALLVIVDGILICSNKNLKITRDAVAMLGDIDFFLGFSWGRKSYSETFSRFGPPWLSSSSPEQNDALISRLKQNNNVCYGFPLPLQLLAFQAIPLLLSRIPDPDDFSTFLENPTGCKSSITRLSEEDILEVESESHAEHGTVDKPVHFLNSSVSSAITPFGISPTIFDIFFCLDAILPIILLMNSNISMIGCLYMELAPCSMIQQCC